MTTAQILAAIDSPDCPADVLEFAQFKKMGHFAEPLEGDSQGDTEADTTVDRAGSPEPDKEEGGLRDNTEVIDLVEGREQADPLDIEVGGPGKHQDDGEEPVGDPAYDHASARVCALLDTLFPDDPADMDVVDRLRSHLEAKPAEPASEEGVLYLPLPVFADVFATYQKLHGDSAYENARWQRVCGTDRWEFSFREGTFVGQVLRRATDVAEAKSALSSLRNRLGPLARAHDAAERAMKARMADLNKLEKDGAPTIPTKGYRRVFDDQGNPVMDEKTGAQKREPVATAKDTEGHKKRLHQARSQFKSATQSCAEAKRRYDDVKKRVNEAKHLIEHSVAEPFSFTVIDAQEGRVRPLYRF